MTQSDIVRYFRDGAPVASYSKHITRLVGSMQMQCFIISRAQPSMYVPGMNQTYLMQWAREKVPAASYRVCPK